MNTPPLLATTMALAAAASFTPIEYMPNTLMPLPRWRGKKVTKRMGLNQRQRRKDRRRAWAAGNRKAFDQ